MSVHLTSALTAIKEHIINYCDTAYQNSGVKFFWSINNSNEALNKLKHCSNITSLNSYDFSTLYTSLPPHQIKEEIKKLIKLTFSRECKTYLGTHEHKSFFTDKFYDKNYKSWTCNEICSALTYLIDNMFVEFENKVYRQIIRIPMGTNCATLIADLFLYCYERHFMDNLAKSKQLDLINKFNRTSLYIDDILNINNPDLKNIFLTSTRNNYL